MANKGYICTEELESEGKLHFVSVLNHYYIKVLKLKAFI